MLLKKEKEVNLEENAVYVVKDGQMYLIESPRTGFGSQKVIWQNNKPVRVEVSTSEQF